MAPRRSAPPQADSRPLQTPLPPFSDEVNAGVQARNEEQLRRIQHKRELNRERARRYRANKKK
jgi:hypothetical protein